MLLDAELSIHIFGEACVNMDKWRTRRSQITLQKREVVFLSAAIITAIKPMPCHSKAATQHEHNLRSLSTPLSLQGRPAFIFFCSGHPHANTHAQTHSRTNIHREEQVTHISTACSLCAQSAGGRAPFSCLRPALGHLAGPHSVNTQTILFSVATMLINKLVLHGLAQVTPKTASILLQ